MSAPFPMALAAFLLAVVSIGCSDNNDPGEGFVVTGTIQNNTGAPLPANTRLVLAWGVSSGSPDYSYIFGQGTVDPAAGTFRLQLDQPPPAQALNAGVLGVGIIVATTNQALGTGDDIDGVPSTDLVGAAGRHGVIFIGPGTVQYREWAADFDTGYSVGVGVDVVDDFDRFEPTDPSSVVLIIDAIENIDFVNWT
ncbi:MAG TPA: hypothetical protein VFH24_03565 [Gemmatimonadales bacterium]|nr:hypothetical protein [Gemmatimonadales bacterium]